MYKCFKIQEKIFKDTSPYSSKNQENIKLNYESITNQINFKRWYIHITLKFKSIFKLKAIALLDMGTD